MKWAVMVSYLIIAVEFGVVFHWSAGVLFFLVCELVSLYITRRQK